jgi:hypothetical protein
VEISVLPVSFGDRLLADVRSWLILRPLDKKKTPGIFLNAGRPFDLFVSKYGSPSGPYLPFLGHELPENQFSSV